MPLLVDIRQLHLDIGSLNINRSLTLHDNIDNDGDDDDGDDADGDDADDDHEHNADGENPNANNQLPLLHFACH